jgi:hypothetical protein
MRLAGNLVHGLNGQMNVILTAIAKFRAVAIGGAKAGLSIFIDVEYPF